MEAITENATGTEFKKFECCKCGAPHVAYGFDQKWYCSHHAAEQEALKFFNAKIGDKVVYYLSKHRRAGQASPYELINFDRGFSSLTAHQKFPELFKGIAVYTEDAKIFNPFMGWTQIVKTWVTVTKADGDRLHFYGTSYKYSGQYVILRRLKHVPK